MTTRTKKTEPKWAPFDAAEYLNDREDVEYFLADALRTKDAAQIARALGVAARSKGMRQIAEQTGLAREQLYRSLSLYGNPTLKTVLAVIDALGLELTAKVKQLDEDEARAKAAEMEHA